MKIKTLELGIEKCKTDLDIKIKAIELGIERHKSDRDGRVKILQMKKDVLDREIENNRVLLRDQKEVEAEGMGHSLDEEDEE